MDWFLYNISLRHERVKSKGVLCDCEIPLCIMNEDQIKLAKKMAMKPLK